MMRTQGSFSNSPGVSTRSSCSCVPSPSSAVTFSGWSRPLSLRAGDQRALERGVRAIVEQIHQRLPDHGARIGVAEQFQPGLVGVDHDAFLHLQDGVVGTLQHRLQLAAIVAGGLQRGVERALQPERAQLARHHRLHAFGRRQRNDIARAEAHAQCDVGLGDLRSDQDHRHLRRELVAHGGRLPGIRIGHIGADQQLGVQLLERLAQVAHRRNPGAVHGFARLAHQTIDELGRFALRRKNDQRNGRIVRQGDSPVAARCGARARQTSGGSLAFSTRGMPAESQVTVLIRAGPHPNPGLATSKRGPTGELKCGLC